MRYRLCYAVRVTSSIGSSLFQLSKTLEKMPAMSPQKAAPIPNNDKPEADTRMVIIAASRCCSVPKATLILDPMVLNSAKPAIDKINSLGKAKNMATTVAPNVAMMVQQIPAKIVALKRCIGF